MSLSTMAAARQKLMKLSATLLTSTRLMRRCCAASGIMTTSNADGSGVCTAGCCAVADTDIVMHLLRPAISGAAGDQGVVALKRKGFIVRGSPAAVVSRLVEPYAVLAV